MKNSDQSIASADLTGRTRSKSPLAIGICLYLIGIILNLLFRNWGSGIEANIFYLFFNRYDLLAAIIIFVLLIPVIDESVFRFWGGGDYRVTSFWMIPMIGILWTKANSTLSIIVISICTILALAALFLTIRNKNNPKHNDTLFFFYTTLIWIVLYLFCSDSRNLSQICDIVKMTGMALVFFYFARQKKLWLAMLLHAASNICIAIPVSLTYTSINTQSFSSEGNTICIERPHRGIGIETTVGDTLFLSGDLADIACKLARKNDTTFNTLYVNASKINTVTYQMKCIGSAGPTTYKAVLDTLVGRQLIKADTSFELLYVVNISDPERLANMQKSNGYKGNVASVIRDLRDTYGYTLYPADGLNTDYPVPLIPNEEYTKLSRRKYMIQFLDKNYGLSVTPSLYDKIRVIRFGVR